MRVASRIEKSREWIASKPRKALTAITAGVVAVAAAGVTAGVMLSSSGGGKSPEAATGMTGADRLHADQLSAQLRAAAQRREIALAEQQQTGNKVDALGKSAVNGLLSDMTSIAGTHRNPAVDPAATSITSDRGGLDMMFNARTERAAEAVAHYDNESRTLTFTGRTDEGKGDGLADDQFAVTIQLPPAARGTLSGQNLSVSNLKAAAQTPGAVTTSISLLPADPNQHYPQAARNGDGGYNWDTVSDQDISDTLSSAPFTDANLTQLTTTLHMDEAALNKLVNGPAYAEGN